MGQGREALEWGGCLLGGVLGIDAAHAQRLKGDHGVQAVVEELTATMIDPTMSRCKSKMYIDD